MDGIVVNIVTIIPCKLCKPQSLLEVVILGVIEVSLPNVFCMCTINYIGEVLLSNNGPGVR